ncbi:hypothetical protein K461DRAFT_161264 [Myriangium duriaei CBS 260.36]|uniref:STEEP1 domain-containing protein n=1 Tax=Myriangium duriaei CBS 260.36 TaxID=1168546 RepID=A0A9P4J0X2_9PEZI|nr:hypothetical protein K461DRAFT_161264 [Myriangium duriaei CBS 260.36]
MPALKAESHHCACKQLLLSTSTPLSALPRRALDRATILPLPTTPSILSSSSSSDEVYFAALPAPLDEYIFSPSSTAAKDDEEEVNSAPEVVIALDDGFEKRILLRCGRCEGVWGYLLDWASWGEEGKGRREDVVFVLEGALGSLP